MQNQKIDNRLYHYDLMRIIACFFVILIHVGVYDQIAGYGNSDFQTLVMNFYGIIARWAVPCFVMLSGMMFLNKNKDIPIKKLYFRYILRLFTSYLFWSLVYCIYNMLYSTNRSLTECVSYIINNWLSGEIHMWYILMTIGLYIIAPILKYLINNAPKQLIKYWLIIMFLFASIIPFVSDLNIPLISGYISYLNQYIEAYFLLGYTLFFILGYYLSINDISPKKEKLIYIFGIIGFAYSVMILIVFKALFSINLGALNYLYPNIIVMSLAVMVFFKQRVSKISFSDKSKAIILSLSKLTYGAFLIHILVLKVLYHLGINLAICNISISAIVVTFIAFVISLGITFVISKIPFINRYIC